MPASAFTRDELFERLSFQLRLVDRIRTLSAPEQIMLAAAEAVGMQLGADRCGYADIVDQSGSVRVEEDWAREGVASLAGEARLLDAFGPEMIEELRAGRTLVVEDCEADPRSNQPEYLPIWAGIETRALIACPLLRDGALTALLYVHQAAPRSWTKAEVSLVEDAALRTRDAVDRGRAEAALRDSGERMRLALIAGGFTDWYWDAETDRVRFSALAAETLNIPVTLQPTSAQVASAVVEEDLPAVVAAGQQALIDGERYQIEYRIRFPDGTVHWMATFGQPVRGADGKVAGVIGITQDISERKASEDALREREQQLAAFINQTTAGFAQVDLTGRFTLVNDRFCEITGRPREELLTCTMQSITHPDDLPANVPLFERAVAEGTPYTLEKRYVRPDGSLIWVNNSVAPVRKASGELYGILAVTIDVTQRKRAEDSQRLLINELNHRVKNTLALVQAIAQQSFSGEGVAAEAKQAFERRLGALAAAHNLLTKSNWEGASLRQVLLEGVSAYQSGERIVASGPDLPLTPKTAVSVAMAVHELVTNAVKYGALSSDGGRIEISWTAQDGRLRLLWQERGGPPVSPPTQRGFGTKMLERGLAIELGGVVKLDYDPGGLVCTLDAPLPTLAEE
jgi:PAS domain S-box-containing protein